MCIGGLLSTAMPLGFAACGLLCCHGGDESLLLGGERRVRCDFACEPQDGGELFVLEDCRNLGGYLSAQESWLGRKRSHGDRDRAEVGGATAHSAHSLAVPQARSHGTESHYSPTQNETDLYETLSIANLEHILSVHKDTVPWLWLWLWF